MKKQESIFGICSVMSSSSSSNCFYLKINELLYNFSRFTRMNTRTKWDKSILLFCKQQ